MQFNPLLDVCMDFLTCITFLLKDSESKAKSYPCQFPTRQAVEHDLFLIKLAKKFAAQLALPWRVSCAVRRSSALSERMFS